MVVIPEVAWCFIPHAAPTLFLEGGFFPRALHVFSVSYKVLCKSTPSRQITIQILSLSCLSTERVRTLPQVTQLTCKAAGLWTR